MWTCASRCTTSKRRPTPSGPPSPRWSTRTSSGSATTWPTRGCASSTTSRAAVGSRTPRPNSNWPAAALPWLPRRRRPDRTNRPDNRPEKSCAPVGIRPGRCHPWGADSSSFGARPTGLENFSDFFSGDADEVDHEHQRLVGLDHAAGAPGAVAQVRRDGEAAATAHLHAGHALVPAADDLAATEAELERVAPVPRGVELLAVRPGHAHVVHLDPLAGRRFGARAHLQVLLDQIAGRGGVGNRHVGLRVGCHAGDANARRAGPTNERAGTATRIVPGRRPPGAGPSPAGRSPGAPCPTRRPAAPRRPGRATPRSGPAG